MDLLLTEERYTWPARTVVSGGSGLGAVSCQIHLEGIELTYLPGSSVPQFIISI